jgi:hypothetical protein
MKTNLKLQLLSNTRITSGVSFESIVKLDKRYSNIFNKMTLGFECEIAVGELELGDGEGSIDIDSLREGFNDSFSFSEQEFLDGKSIDQDFMETYEVKGKYGEVPPEFEKDIDDTITQLEKLNFTVAYNPATPDLLFTPDVISVGYMRDFTYSVANVDFEKAGNKS